MSTAQTARISSLEINWGLVWLAIAALAAGFFFVDGLDALLAAWQQPEYSHGPLIPILSGFMFLRQLKEYPIEPGPKNDRWVGVTLLVFAVFCGALGKLSNINDVVAYATIIWVGAILLISFGWKPASISGPPFCTLFICCPCPA